VVTNRLKAFISYSTTDKAAGAEVKRALNAFGVDSFLAHNDLRISDEWKDRILEELTQCHIFVPLLSKAFRTSNWTQQETGIAVSRKGVLIIPLSLDGTVPFGFISHIQGKEVPESGAESSMFQDLLLEWFPRAIIPALIERAAEASSFRGAEALVEPLVDLFPVFSKKEANQFATAAVAKRQIWSADLCRTEYLPAFLKSQGKNISRKTLKALKYQIENDEHYPA